ncbi:MAG: hypothetical protein SGJ19_07575 [Planctomycetia bacterium]|nr:hypothetical protein [Planctomycetia bacterium]
MPDEKDIRMFIEVNPAPQPPPDQQITESDKPDGDWITKGAAGPSEE